METQPPPLPVRLPGFVDNPPGFDFDGPTEGPLGYAVVYDTTGRQLGQRHEYANGEDFEATLGAAVDGAGPWVLGPLVRATDGITGTSARVGLYDYAGRLAATVDVPVALTPPASAPLADHVTTLQLLGRSQAENWITRTTAELTELVDRAQNLLRTGAGNDVERDAVRDQADMLEIVAALLPAWVDRGVHPVTENNIELAATRLLHLIDELDG